MAAPAVVAKAAATPAGRRVIRLAIIGVVGLLLLPVLLLVLIVMPAADCAPPASVDDGSIPSTWDGPGSLGGVAGTGVTAAELSAARKRGGGLKITAGPYRSTAYAPIAGGVNCGNGCGYTASGIRVDNGRRRAYLIASNPRLNSYGSLAYIWPNPYDWRGPFVVADTGGDFGGAGRLDFYTFEPRSLSKALSWGNTKMVQVSSKPIVSGGPGDAGSGVQTVPVADRTAPASPEASSSRWPAPVPGPITSGFGPRSSPGGIGSTNHEGIDFGVPIGTPIKVPVAGRVIFAGTMSGYGNYVCVLHQPALSSCYAHLSRINVSVGRAVAAGQVIALSGNTGNSTGPHLHFEVRRSATPAGDPAVDPRKFLSGEAPTASVVDAAEHQCPGAVDTTDVAGSVDPASGAAAGYPTRGGQGQIIGRPGQGTHSFAAAPNNWQSDRAIDIGIPSGTPLLATEDGVICARCGFGTLDASASSRFGGMRFTLTANSGRQWYYAHLSRLAVRPGQRVKRGELVGYSGVANGVAHLHLGLSAGDILAVLGITKQV
ncbi:MAG: peptidoglycan DD-metalloendopeptidase family protein [Solirubrobacteraceae bacterium]|nr:peptidoglycan DD-metalloendopeptidase family protein [Solirubrobacteraceae bacterium]